MSSDRPVTGITVILNGSNYPYWSHLMQNFLKGQKLWEYIHQQIPPPDRTDAKFEEAKFEE